MSLPVEQHSPLHISVNLYGLIFISEGNLPLGMHVCLFKEMDVISQAKISVFSIDTNVNKSSFLPLH